MFGKVAAGYLKAAEASRDKQTAAEKEQRQTATSILMKLVDDPSTRPETIKWALENLTNIAGGKFKGKLDISQIPTGQADPGQPPELGQMAAPAGQPQPQQRQMPTPPPPTGEQYLMPMSPEEQARQNAPALQLEAAAKRRGTLTAEAEFTTTTPPTGKQKDFEFLAKQLGDTDKARKLIFGLLPGEDPTSDDKAVFTDEDGNRVAIFFTPDGVSKRVVLGKAGGRDAGVTLTAAQKNYNALIKQGLDPSSARQLAFGLTVEERDRVPPAEFAQRILQFARWAYFDTSPSSIQKALDFVNAGLPPDKQITPQDIASMMRSARPSELPSPPGTTKRKRYNPETGKLE
ncbi:hypothetical protein LCGC14_1430300 [marine sediment metagenome]|uniref:Uncharacterized protein n=1 Tax=marine sediment metagenome TaxID=412755 RepID=A0A0F9JP40_9ZZZZ